MPPPSGGSLRGLNSKHTAFKNTYPLCKKSHQHLGEDNYSYCLPQNWGNPSKFKEFLLRLWRASWNSRTHLKPLIMPARNHQACPRDHSPVVDLSGGPLRDPKKADMPCDTGVLTTRRETWLFLYNDFYIEVVCA